MELTKTFSPEQFQHGLECWQWRGVHGMTPWFTTLFGDVFLLSGNAVCYLDIVDGTLAQPWPDQAAMQAELNTRPGQVTYLRVGLARAARDQAVALDPSQVYDFRHPPALGGAMDVSNMSAADFVTTLGMAGQIHEQIKDLPPGAQVNIVVED